jgi:CIC family chloride channel protein
VSEEEPRPTTSPRLAALERRLTALWYGLARFLGLASAEELSFFILTPLVGLATGFAGVAIYNILDWVQHTVWQSNGTLLEAAYESSLATPWRNVLAPVIGGIGVFLIVWISKTRVKGGGMSVIIESVALKGGRVPLKDTLLREIAGIATVGTGGSLGREGPLIRTGAMIGSIIGLTGGVSGRRLKVLVAAGCAAGMAAAYNAPVGGAIFAMEVILGNFALEVFGPIVVASVLATQVARAFRVNHPVYDMGPIYELKKAWELPWYLVLGVVSGPISVFFQRGVRSADRFFDNMPVVPVAARPIVGMALLGVLGIACPYVYGNGFDTVQRALHGELSVGLLLLLPLVKILATSLTLGSGCSGGLFTPALFVGGLLGGAFGCFVQVVMPGAAPPAAYALAGMAAITAGTSHAPISAILIIFEMTGRYEAILPLMLAAMGSAAIARRMTRHSIYTESLAKRGIELPSRLEEFVLETIRVSEVVRPDREVVGVREKLDDDLLERFFRSKRSHIFVVDEQGHFAGAVTLHELGPVLADPSGFKGVVAADVLDPSYPTVRETDRLAGALGAFARAEGDSLPVVDERAMLKGIIAKQDVLALYSQEVLGQPALLARIGPEAAMGASYVPLPEGFHLRELPVPDALVGRSLVEINLPQRLGIWVLAVVRSDEAGRERRELANATTVLARGDRLVVLGSAGGIDQLAG